MISKKSDGSSFWNVQVPFHPWIYFAFFLASNTLLSFAPMDPARKLWVGLGGILLPFIAGLHAAWEFRKKRKKTTPSTLETAPVPGWFWALSFGLLFFTRLYHLTSLPFWPLSDEGISGFLAIRQSQHWHWNLLWAQDRVEPFLIWFLGLYFKLLHPSLFSLRLAAALFSIGTCLAAYWAARCYLGPFPSFVCFWFFLSSFWELTLSRNCLVIIPVPLFQCLCLGFLGRVLQASSPSHRRKSLWVLSFLGVVGFYTWTNWAAVWLGLAFLLALDVWGEDDSGKKELLIFGAVTALGVFPLALARLAPGELDHIRELGTFSLFKPAWGYLQGIFWNGFVSFPFGPNWGGMFNPVTDSLVLLGFLYLFQTADRRALYFGALLLFCSVLPGILTNNIDLNRMLPLYTLLSVPVAFGFHSLVVPGMKRVLHTFLFFLLLGTSSGLDFFNYYFHYCNPAGIPPGKQWRSVEYDDAYNILSDLNRKSGYINVFSEFNTDYDNKTLDIADYSFNAVENPDLSISKAPWTCIITNIQYAPYFIKTFRTLRLKVLKTDKTGPNDPKPFGIFLIPTSNIPAPVLENWKKTDEVFRTVDFQIKNKKSTDLWAQFIGSVPPQSILSLRDPFLKAVYWEKVGFFKFLDDYFIQATEAYRKAIKEGIPAAHLYNDLGVCLKIQNRPKEAKKNFEKAALLSKRME